MFKPWDFTCRQLVCRVLASRSGAPDAKGAVMDRQKGAMPLPGLVLDRLAGVDDLTSRLGWQPHVIVHQNHAWRDSEVAQQGGAP